jgi:hypothetical protein
VRRLAPRILNLGTVVNDVACTLRASGPDCPLVGELRKPLSRSTGDGEQGISCPYSSQVCTTYSGRKITASLGNVTVRGEKYGKGKGEARRRRVCLSMYSITENIYCSQLSSGITRGQACTV